MEKILGSKMDEGKHWFHVKWKEVDFAEWVLSDDADFCCPRLVIDYYEQFINWSAPLNESTSSTAEQKVDGEKSK